MIPQYRLLLQRADNIVQLSKRNQGDEFMSSQLAAHACVLLSAAVESAIRELVPAFAADRSHPAVSSYIKESLSNFTNANPDKVLSLFRQFDNSWCDKLETFWSNEIKDHLGSVIGNRHLIAHGKNTTISPTRIDEWRRSIHRFCNYLESELL